MSDVAGAARADTALLLCAHGTKGVAGAVSTHAEALAARGIFHSVQGGALYGTPKIDCVLCGLDAPRAVLVPFMMAAGYTLETLRTRLAAHPWGERVHLADPVGVRAEIPEMVAEMGEAAAAGRGWAPGEVALLVVGHGTRKHSASGATARASAAEIADSGRFAEVGTAFLDEPPEIGEAVAAFRAPACVAVGFFTDAGNHGREDVPELLAETGVPHVYAGPLGPDPRMAELILKQGLAAA
ncbi:CbiX/SirB N-terminal domain-containing protein [Limimonas halophila]|nr:CbiX/SirB N-terminal domain-containing protein [Limimonas halophila]